MCPLNQDGLTCEYDDQILQPGTALCELRKYTFTKGKIFTNNIKEVKEL